MPPPVPPSIVARPPPKLRTVTGRRRVPASSGPITSRPSKVARPSSRMRSPGSRSTSFTRASERHAVARLLPAAASSPAARTKYAVAALDWGAATSTATAKAAASARPSELPCRGRSTGISVWSARAQVASAACGVAPRHHRHRPPRGLERRPRRTQRHTRRLAPSLPVTGLGSRPWGRFDPASRL